MIVDSSVWIEHLRDTGSASVVRLRQALVSSRALWMPDVIYMEVLCGTRDLHHFASVQMQLDQVPPLVLAYPQETARHAALLYARCRWRGITIRSPNGCLIVACAIEAGQPLLHADRDFERIASIAPDLKFA